MSKSRILRKLHSGGYFSHSGVPGENPLNTPDGWEWIEAQSPSGAYNYGILYKIDYYDLSGYELKDDTIFPQAFLVQDIGLPGAGATTTPNIETCNLLLTKVPRVTDVTNVGEFTWHLPGAPQSRYGLEEVLSGQWNRFTYSTAYGQILPTGSTSWGTGAATAGQKMFILRAYKVLLLSTTIDFDVPDTGLVVPALIDKEEELEYMMRLKRSYELQGAV